MQTEMEAMKERINQQEEIKKRMDAIEDRLNSELNMNNINFFKRNMKSLKNN